jgi:Peptidase family S41
VTMRASVGAFVLGEDVPSTLAESRWIGIGNAGLAVRTGRLLTSEGAPLPDVITADHRSVDARASLRDINWSAPRARPRGAATRPALSSLERPNAWNASSTRVGDARAALIVAYAAARTFFPYLDEVGDGLDARLDESLAIIEKGPQADRAIVRKALRRFAEVLHDGHAWVFDDRKPAPPWGSPVALLPANDAMVVAVSSTPKLEPGDAVLAIGGTPVATLMDEGIRCASGSPHAVRAGVAERMVQTDVPISIRHSSGAVETITIPQGAPVSTTHRMFERASGPLHALGASDVYYLTLDASSPHGPNERNVPEIKAAMAGKRGVILDMRGYPSRAAWSVLAHVASRTSRGPQMAELIVTPSSRALGPFFPLQDLTMWTSETHGYDGPVIVLTGARTQSQAEHWLSFFRSEKRGKLVGGQTSGANGTITGVQLPGGYGLTFTGMFVRHGDGSRFHAIGHIPDIAVEPTIEDLRQKRDTVLLRAVAELNREHPRSVNGAK